MGRRCEGERASALRVIGLVSGLAALALVLPGLGGAAGPRHPYALDGLSTFGGTSSLFDLRALPSMRQRTFLGPAGTSAPSSGSGWSRVPSPNPLAPTGQLFWVSCSTA